MSVNVTVDNKKYDGVDTIAVGGKVLSLKAESAEVRIENQTSVHSSIIKKVV